MIHETRSLIGQRLTVDGVEYEIMKLLARGKGGYNYLVNAGDAAVAVKQIHYEPCDYFQFEDNKLSSELRDYQILFDLGIPMPKLLSYDQERQILVKEYVDGETLAQIVAENRLRSSHISQIFDMCNKLYQNNLNIDYFPTNFMEQAGKLYYVDYECSKYSDEWNFENWGIWFLANRKGMKSFIKNNDHGILLKDGKPIHAGFEKTVQAWLQRN